MQLVILFLYAKPLCKISWSICVQTWSNGQNAFEHIRAYSGTVTNQESTSLRLILDLICSDYTWQPDSSAAAEAHLWCVEKDVLSWPVLVGVGQYTTFPQKARLSSNATTLGTSKWNLHWILTNITEIQWAKLTIHFNMLQLYDLFTSFHLILVAARSLLRLPRRSCGLARYSGGGRKPGHGFTEIHRVSWTGYK